MNILKYQNILAVPLFPVSRTHTLIIIFFSSKNHELNEENASIDSWETKCAESVLRNSSGK